MAYHDELMNAVHTFLKEDTKKKKELTRAEIEGMTDDQIKALTDDDIVSVYSGKPGCACGCLGIHRYNPKYQAVGTQRRGYKVEGDEMNLTHVKKVLKIMQTNAPSVERGSNNLSIETGGKLYIVYPY